MTEPCLRELSGYLGSGGGGGGFKCSLGPNSEGSSESAQGVAGAGPLGDSGGQELGVKQRCGGERLALAKAEGGVSAGGPRRNKGREVGNAVLQ